MRANMLLEGGRLPPVCYRPLVISISWPCQEIFVMSLIMERLIITWRSDLDDITVYIVMTSLSCVLCVAIMLHGGYPGYHSVYSNDQLVMCIMCSYHATWWIPGIFQISG